MTRDERSDEEPMAHEELALTKTAAKTTDKTTDGGAPRWIERSALGPEVDGGRRAASRRGPRLLGVLLRHELRNALRGKWIFGYLLLFAGFTEGLLGFGTDPARSVASLMSLVLLVIPMFSTLYAAMYWYGAEGFTLLLSTQPVARGWIFAARWLALSLALGAGYTLGVGVPLAIEGALDGTGALLLLLGNVLACTFAALGLLVAIHVPDRTKGVGAAFLVWFYFAIVHDSLVFLLLSTLSDYPMELPAMVLIGVNPIDLARVLILMTLDQSALMGYTGTILQRTLGSSLGGALAALTLSLWVTVPPLLGLRAFTKRDL